MSRTGVPPPDRGPRGGSHGVSPDARLLRGVRWRLVVWSGGSTFAVLVLLGIAAYLVVAASLAASSEQQLRTRLDEIQRRAAGAPPPGDTPTGQRFGGSTAGTFALIVGPDNRVAGQFRPTGLPNWAGVAAARAGRQDVQVTDAGGVPVRILSAPLLVNGATFTVQVAQDRTTELRTLETLILVLVIGGGMAVIGASALGALYARRALIPIRESLRRQREFAADASHELRTPLAVIRASVEHLERHADKPVRAVGEAVRDIRDEVDHLTGMVGDLLLLARADSGVVELEERPLDLADVVAEAMSPMVALAAGREVELNLDPRPAPMVGDPQRLAQLITILVDNAIAHSPMGADVTVAVRHVGGHVSVTVDDAGPGIRPEDVEHVFDRFWRAPGAPPGGTGLGLAIAAWIARSHDGSISVSNRIGGGARFEVRLPASGSRPPDHTVPDAAAVSSGR